MTLISRVSGGLFRCLSSARCGPLNHRVTLSLPGRTKNVALYSTSVVAADGIVSSPHKDMDLPVISMREHLFGCMGKYRDNIAIESVDRSQKYTYTQLQDAVVRVGSALHRMGYRKGDVICIADLNSVEYMIIFLAISSIGCVSCCMHVLLQPEMLKTNIEQAGCVALVTSKVFLGKFTQICGGNENIRNVITLDGPAEKCRSFSSLMEDDGLAFPDNVDISPKEDTLKILYSSGTTGPPKGVLISHYASISNIRTFRIASPPSVANPVTLHYLPLYHVTGCMIDFLIPMYNGAKVVVAPGFNPDTFLQILADHKVTDLLCVPTILLYMVKHPALAQTDLSALNKTLVVAAPCGADISMAYVERVSSRLVQGYGMTETGMTNVDQEPVTIGSTGPMFPNNQAKVVDIQTGEALGPGREGEICLRGPSLMSGYLNNPKATSDVMKNTWIHSGDIGKYDEQGKIYITDRLKELIKYKSHQVAPSELEDILISHPGIRDAAVIGRPDEVAGELPMAFVVLQPDTELSEKQIQDYVAGHVDPFSKLRGGVQFMDEIPKSPTGKLLRRVLKEGL